MVSQSKDLENSTLNKMVYVPYVETRKPEWMAGQERLKSYAWITATIQKKLEDCFVIAVTLAWASMNDS